VHVACAVDRHQEVEHHHRTDTRGDQTLLTMSPLPLQGSVFTRCQVPNGSQLFHPGVSVKGPRLLQPTRCSASGDNRRQSATALEEKPREDTGRSNGFSLGDVLGPIGLTFSSIIEPKVCPGTKLLLYCRIRFDSLIAVFYSGSFGFLLRLGCSGSWSTCLTEILCSLPT
jgi:hypothetical protein